MLEPKASTSPYVVLGVPVGSNRREIADGFARARRRLRSNPAPPFTPEDLAAVEHELTKLSADDAFSFRRLRVPLDAALYDGPTDTDPRTLLAPRNLGRRTQPTTDGDLAVLAQEAADTLVQALVIELDDSISRLELEGSLHGPTRRSAPPTDRPSKRPMVVALAVLILVIATARAVWHWSPPGSISRGTGIRTPSATRMSPRSDTTPQAAFARRLHT